MSKTARLGIFVLIALILFGLGIFQIGKGMFLFRNTYVLRAGFETVAGLGNGAEVRVGGVRVGTVSSIELPEHPGGKVNVVMELDNASRHLIRKDSVASIQTEGLIGNKYVRVTFGSEHAAPIQEGDQIASIRNPDLSDIVQQTTEVLRTTNSALKNIEAATVDVKDITDKINSGQGTLGKLVNNNDIYRELHSTAAQISGTAEEAKAGVTGFKENMEALKHNWLFRGYFKSRGYTDESELTRYQVDRIPDRAASKAFVLDAGDLFSSDKAKLKHKKRLDDIGRYLESNPYGLVVITAWSDLRGDSHEDLKITEARAMVLREYLVKNFKLNDTRIKTKGLGKKETDPSRPPEGIEVLVYSGQPSGNNLAQ